MEEHVRPTVLCRNVVDDMHVGASSQPKASECIYTQMRTRKEGHDLIETVIAKYTYLKHSHVCRRHLS